MLKFKNSDKVIIISGQYKGRIGKIIKIFKNENRAYISSIFHKKKYIKNNKIIHGYKLIKYFKINISNISILDPKLKIRTRIGFKIINGKKFRICKKSKTILSNNKTKYVYT
ncbi:MAG: 50S ribosomal protein L24 [Candidatus Shikimatogenerans bostrichidophilus]|nr:MAG: 50S ribosomal protein L24 [Candidatus Shikimatogenerans bostrichidophilus]